MTLFTGQVQPTGEGFGLLVLFINNMAFLFADLI